MQRILQSDIIPKKHKARFADLAIALEGQRYSEVDEAMTRTLSETVEVGLPMAWLNDVTGHVRDFIEFELIKLIARVNIDQRLSISVQQRKFIVEELYEMFKYESIEDIALCFRRGALGLYGEIYKLDGSVLGIWMKKYLEEKAIELEAQKAAEADKLNRPQGPTNPERDLLSLFKIVVGDQTLAENNAKENAYQRFKLGHHPPTEAQVHARELHLAYVRANYDAISGKPLPNWLPELDWIQLQKAPKKKVNKK